MSSQGASSRKQWQLVSEPNEFGQQLRVCFVRQGDRYQHRVEWLEEKSPSHSAEQPTGPLVAAPVLSSVEGDGGDSWPPSPPLQDLDECVLAAGATGIVGVGMAGKSHWSLAVEAVKDAIWFDAACRVNESPRTLGSTYDLGDDWLPRTIIPHAESGEVMAGPVWDARTDRGRSWRLELAVGTWTRQGSTLVIKAVPDPDESPLGTSLPRTSLPRTSLPRTIRWRYGFRCLRLSERDPD